MAARRWWRPWPGRPASAGSASPTCAPSWPRAPVRPGRRPPARRWCSSCPRCRAGHWLSTPGAVRPREHRRPRPGRRPRSRVTAAQAGQLPPARPELLQDAKTQRWAPEELLRALVEAECAARDASMAAARLKAANFPVKKSFQDFDFSASAIPRPTLEYLASLEWVRAKEWPCLVGPPGTGKSHVLIAAGHAAVEAGYKVRYFGAAELVEALYRGLADNSVGKVIDSVLRADAVVVDEVGFAPLDDTGAQLLFRFVAAAYERRAVAIGSHWPFEKAHMFWPTCARWCLTLTASPRRPALRGRCCRPCNAGRRPRSARRR